MLLSSGSVRKALEISSRSHTFGSTSSPTRRERTCHMRTTEEGVLKKQRFPNPGGSLWSLPCFGVWERKASQRMSLNPGTLDEDPRPPTHTLTSFFWGWHSHFCAARLAQSWCAEDEEPTPTLKGLLHTSINSETQWTVTQEPQVSIPPLRDGRGTQAGANQGQQWKQRGWVWLNGTRAKADFNHKWRPVPTWWLGSD